MSIYEVISRDTFIISNLNAAAAAMVLERADAKVARVMHLGQDCYACVSKGKVMIATLPKRKFPQTQPWRKF